MADAVDQGSLASDDLDSAREERDSAVAEERGLPDSASNDNPLPLEAIDEMVNKAEGDHEALAENAYQAKVVEETDGLKFDGLTSVDAALREEQLEQIHEDAPGSKTGEEANIPSEAKSSDSADATDGARELAAERGIDLSEVKGSGKDGRITQADVEAHS